MVIRHKGFVRLRASLLMLLTKSLNSTMITPHPKGTHARVLLASVFGPYA
jgi:hypothetical protein